MIRFHTTQYQDAVTAAQAMKGDPMFRGYSFRRGMHKNASGVWVIRDLGYADGYGPAIQVDEHTIIQVSESRETAIANLPSLERMGGVPIAVKLVCGATISINPATGEPKEFLFSSHDAPEPFSAATPYGRACMRFVERQSAEKDPISVYDPDVVTLARLALEASYAVPAAFWDATRLLTSNDIDKIITAALGADPDFFTDAGRPSDTPACAKDKAVP
jgi:hypothetical protein